MPFGHSKDITGLMVFVICGVFFLGCSTVSQVHFTKGIRDHEGWSSELILLILQRLGKFYLCLAGLFFGALAKYKSS